jgi:hypothetical protein
MREIACCVMRHDSVENDGTGLPSRIDVEPVAGGRARRSLAKKLRRIEVLEAKVAAGASLSTQEQAKVPHR